MIEINLLPQEYRPRDSTNVPLMLTALGGIVLVCGLMFYLVSVQNELRDLEHAVDDLTKKKADLELQAKKVDALKEEIERQKSRQETIIEISQSKVMWSQKLEQFARVMGSHRNFWVNQLNLTKTAAGGSGGSTFSMRVSGLHYDLNEVAKLRDALQNDQNFFYHFTELQSYSVSRASVTGMRNATERMDFEVKLPVAVGTPAGRN
ncbi:MAG: hypothetical protein M9894_30890 [Planctomycetes bacterium]|nr:hypothetical protein [Planctomycetota bacterium]